MQLSKRTTGALVALLTLSLLTISCDALDYLQLAIGAAEVAIPLIPIGDANTKSIVENALATASDAITQVADIEAGTGSTAEKAAAVTALLASTIQTVTAADKNIPAQYAALANAVAQVAAYLAKYLATLPAPTAATARVSTPSQPSPKVKAKLAAIRLHAQQIYMRIFKMHH